MRTPAFVGLSVQVLLGVLFVACPPSRPVEPAASTRADGGEAQDDGGGAGPQDASVGGVVGSLAVDLVGLGGDGGRAAATVGDAGVLELLEPVRALELQFSAAVKNARIRIFDEREQVLESDDTLIEPEAGGRPPGYRIELLEPLRPGTYVLGIDGELWPKLLDGSGNPLDDVRVAFRVLGDPEPKRAPRPEAPKRRQRRR